MVIRSEIFLTFVFFVYIDQIKFFFIEITLTSTNITRKPTVIFTGPARNYGTRNFYGIEAFSKNHAYSTSSRY